ncbi:probable metal-nicotianamine transporter YSL7 isoform X2 [Cucumis sativus]|uniref:probable metal-nicotianamine transporter YSL7 isoform X2 n=1 Tax=Cucumis sativus TaxID=3659 RepID=UPI0012F4A4C9|nr:probable metal-nicotianamine transporter YSL7 isoform X2 [Cucumis sativus]
MAEESSSVEKSYESEELLPWRKQLTARAFVVSLFLSALFTFIVMNINLTTGLIPPLNVSAALLGYVFLKIWTKFHHKSLPFTRQENTVIQTCVVASVSVAFTGGFGSYLLAMSQRINELSEAKDNDFKNPSLGWIIGFLFIVSFLGPFLVLLFRKRMIMDFKLTYPSGTATAHLINSFHTSRGAKLAKFYFDFSATYVGVGMICPYTINISLLLGAILSWGLMWPLIEKKKGDWFSAELHASSFHGLQSYKVFFFIALTLGDGIYNFVKVLATTILHLFSELKKDVNAVSNPSLRSTSGVSFDDNLRTQHFLKELQIPSRFAIGGYVILAVISITTLPRFLPLLKLYYMLGDTLPHIFPQLKWYYILVLYVIAPVLAFCNAYGTGLTDWSLASAYGKLAIFIIGAWAGATHGGAVAGLAACGVMINIVATASDLMQDFKTGYMTLSSPRSMFVSQVVGTAMGCVISPCVFWLFYKAFDDIGQPESAYPAPYATVYRNMALLAVEGVSSLPKNCLYLSYLFFAAAIVLNLIRDLLEKKVSQYIPIPTAMAIPFYIGPYFAIDMCLGSLILFVWEKINKAKADAFAPAVASGLICGDGIWTLPRSILALAGVKPPICMKFLSRTANVKVTTFLAT